jgi:transposase
VLASSCLGPVDRTIGSLIGRLVDAACFDSKQVVGGMLTVETISRIRREHFVKGKTIREISRDLKVSRNTVRKVLRSGETSFEYERDVQSRPKLGRWTTDLHELLENNTTKPFREQLTLIRIFEELRGRGYDGGYDAVRDTLSRFHTPDCADGSTQM